MIKLFEILGFLAFFTIFLAGIWYLPKKFQWIPDKKPRKRNPPRNNHEDTA